MFTIKSTTEEKVLLTLTPKTAAGNDAKIDGVPTWEVTEGDATFDVQPDGLSAFAVSGTVQTSKLRVTADADLGPGVIPIVVEGEYIVTDPSAANLGISAADPVLK